MLRKIVPSPLYSLLKPTFKSLQNGYYRILDTTEAVLGTADPMVPPRSRIFIGGGDFRKQGIEFKNLFIKLGHLKPGDHVLDIGCGIGRMAIPLTNYLSRQGSYEGFDIVKDGVDWCRERITKLHPNFHFQQADIHNDHYNPAGRFKGSDYRFPYADRQFDFAFLTSVFTHMPKAEVERYVAEIGRVLKPGGRCLVTFFLINAESKQLMGGRKSAHNIKHYVDGRYIAYLDDPEICVGFEESYVSDLFAKHGMTIAVYPGSWCGREQYTSFQDIVVASKIA